MSVRRNAACWLVWMSTLAWPMGLSVAAEPTRAEYAALAAEISQDYVMPGRQHDGVPARTALEAAAKNPAQECQKAARIMLSALDQEREIIADKKLFRKYLRTSSLAMLERAERGDFVTRESFYDNDSLGKPIPRTTTRDDTAEAMAKAKAGLTRVEAMTDDNIAREAKSIMRQMMDGFRAKAWDELEPAARKLAGPKSQSPLAEIVHPDKTTFRVRNIADRPLTGVTLVVEFTHYSTLPKPTFRHVYFLPAWKPKQVVDLSATFLPNAKMSAPRRYSVSVSEKDTEGRQAPNPELLRMAGVVQTTVRVYADEAWQDTITVTHQDRLTAVAKVQIEHSRNMLASSLTADVTQKLLDLDLKPLSTVLLPNSELGKQVERMLNDPKSVRREILAAGDANFLKQFAAGQRYEGTFFARNNNGSAGLIFVACDKDGKEVRAELFDPKNPGTLRMFGGAVVNDPQTQRQMLVLSALAPTTNPPPRPNIAAIGMNVFDDSVKTITVRYDRLRPERPLVWQASTSNPQAAIFVQDPIGLALKPAEADAKHLAAAEQRVKENRGLKLPDIGTLAPATRKGPPAAPQRPKKP